MFGISDARRALTAQGRLAVVLIAALAMVVLTFMILQAIGFRFDPFGLTARKADRAQAAAAAAADNASARSLEAEGERRNAQRVEVVVRQASAATHATYTLSAQAWSADDASLPLPPDRADRLRAHDRELCWIRSSVTGCAASDPDAIDGGGGLRPLPPAGPPDPGGS